MTMAWPGSYEEGEKWNGHLKPCISGLKNCLKSSFVFLNEWFVVSGILDFIPSQSDMTCLFSN